MQLQAPGRLDLVEREVPGHGTNEVLIAFEACGVCGTDANDIACVDTTGHRPHVVEKKVAIQATHRRLPVRRSVQ
jgi:alcohol dehydrogenase